MTKITINLCKNCSSNLENEIDKKNRLSSYFVSSNECLIIKAEKVYIFNQSIYARIVALTLTLKLTKNQTLMLLCSLERMSYHQSGQSLYLQSEWFYQYSDDSVCPKSTKITMNLCKNCGSNLDNEVDKKADLHHILFARTNVLSSKRKKSTSSIREVLLIF